MVVCIFFFFKQKTAYEMRISDWSSDVCSSDLLSGNLAYTDTEVRGLIVSCYAGQSAAQGCVGGRQDVTGEALTNAPKWAWTLNANYGADIGNDLRGSANLSFTWRSKTLFGYPAPNTAHAGTGFPGGRVALGAPERRRSGG